MRGLVTAECFGISGLGKLLALIIMGYSVAQWMGPVLAGRIYDATRSYDAAWAVTTVAGVLGAATIHAISPHHQGLILHSLYHRPRGWDHVPPGRQVPCGESSMWGDYHARELALLLLREVRREPYLAFFNVG